MTLSELNAKVARNTEKINLINNGAFTRFVRDVSFIENSADEIDGVRHSIDRTLYQKTSYSWNIDAATSQLIGSWSISGQPCSITVSPKHGDIVLPSYDGGNVLQLTFRNSGDIVLEQEIADPYRLQNTTITAAMSGRQFGGKSVAVVSLVLDDVPTTLVQANSASFGQYRRFYRIYSINTKPTKASLRITISGVQGESLGLSGITLVLGSSERQPYVTSMADRVMSPGIVIMYEGETCPPGYADVSSHSTMAIVSGSNFQSVGGTLQQTIGSDTHDHTHKANPLAPTLSATIPTNVPMEAQDVRIVHGIPFHEYPPQIAYTPYKGERPLNVLSNLHRHNIATDMEGIPPTFPLRMCKRL